MTIAEEPATQERTGEMVALVLTDMMQDLASQRLWSSMREVVGMYTYQSALHHTSVEQRGLIVAALDKLVTLADENDEPSTMNGHLDRMIGQLDADEHAAFTRFAMLYWLLSSEA